MIKFTKADRKVIDGAHGALSYVITSQFGGSVAAQFERATKAGRGQADSPCEARAWAVRAFMHGWHSGADTRATELCGATEWWLYGVIAGIDARRQLDGGRCPGQVSETRNALRSAAICRAVAAVDAYEAAREREFAALRVTT